MSENKQFTIKRPSKTYPHTIGLYYRILEIIGHTNKVKFNLEWQNKLKLGYFILFHWFAASSCLSHLISTFTRSIRFVDEFLHRLFEDFAFNLFYFDCNIFIFRYDEVQAMVKYMETSFSMSNEKIVQKCNKKGKTTLLLFLIIGAVATSGSILETFFRSTEEEMDMIRYVYHRKHPERLLQTNFYVPFVDDSESPYYEIIWITELLMISLVNFAIGVSGSFVPTLVTHIEGQYEILCSYVENLGRIHLDEDENRIIYTDIINNQILRINDEKKFRGNFEVFRYSGKCTLDPKIEELYQQDYCRQIVKFHQVLIHFQEKVKVYNSVY